MRSINQSINQSNNIHLLADLLIALRGDEHFNAGLVHVVDVGPVSLDLGVFYATGQAVDGTCRPGENTQPLISAEKDIYFTSLYTNFVKIKSQRKEKLL